MNRGFHITGNMKRAVEAVANAPVRGAAITGDLARTSGLKGDYQALKGLLEPLSSRMPVALALGNHDDRANFLEAFPENPGTSGMVNRKHVLVIELAPVRLILLDSLLHVNKTEGLLGKAQRTWLDEYLRTSANLPTLLFLHHPLNDSDGALLDTDRFLSIVRPHRKVKAIFYGHSHQYRYDEDQGVHVVNIPATGYAFAPSEPVGWLRANFTGEGADLTLHAIGGNRELDGKTKSLAWRA